MLKRPAAVRNLPITRRSFFQGVVSVFVGACATIGFFNRTGLSTHSSLTKIIAEAFQEDGQMLPPISSRFLDQDTALAPLQEKLCSIIFADEPSHASSLVTNHERLVSAITSDYEQGTLLNADGWYVSETEYLMLSYLSRMA